MRAGTMYKRIGKRVTPATSDLAGRAARFLLAQPDSHGARIKREVVSEDVFEAALAQPAHEPEPGVRYRCAPLRAGRTDGAGAAGAGPGRTRALLRPRRRPRRAPSGRDQPAWPRARQPGG